MAAARLWPPESLPFEKKIGRLRPLRMRSIQQTESLMCLWSHEHLHSWIISIQQRKMRMRTRGFENFRKCLIWIFAPIFRSFFFFGNGFLIFSRVLWWGHKRGFQIMGTWCSRSTWACNATQYVAILVNHWTSASDTMVIFLLTFLGWFPLGESPRVSEIPGTHLFYGFPPFSSEKEEPLREML